MGGIKYYQLSKDEELPDEFCAVKDIGGEPSEYTFYVPDAENAKLRELVREAHSCKTNEGCCEDCYREEGCCPVERRIQELGVEVD